MSGPVSAFQMHAGEIDAELEHVGVARQRLRGEQAAVRQAPDPEALLIDVRSGVEPLGRGQHVTVLRVPASAGLRRLRNARP
jgi:hypothetical protein